MIEKRVEASPPPGYAPRSPLGEFLTVTECPKCGSASAWFEKNGRDVWLQCLCGVNKLVFSEVETITIYHTETAEKVSLPRPGTRLWHCLAMLYGLGQASTHEITERVNLNTSLHLSASDVASFLTVLRYKGLVFPLENRRGHIGGSVWKCTDPAKKLLGG